MFIVVNIDANRNLVAVYDTKDGVCETVSLYPLAVQIVQKKLKVVGLSTLGCATRDSIPIPNYNIAVNLVEAKKALATDYMRRFNMSQQEAYMRVGLV
jgi:hypothetical protein